MDKMVGNLDLKLANYVGFKVYGVTRIKKGFGFRVKLYYADSSFIIQQKAGFSSERMANDARDKTVFELGSRTYIVYGNVRVKDFFPKWLEEKMAKKPHSNNTYETYYRNIKNHIVPHIGNKYMTKVTPIDIKDLYWAVAKESYSSAKLTKTIIRNAFAFAKKMHIIADDVSCGIELQPCFGENNNPSQSQNRVKSLSGDQILELLERSKSGKIHVMLCFNVLMGLRESEIIGLKYEDVDFVKRKIRVERQLGKRLKAQKEDYPPKMLTKQEKPLKTEAGYRTLPIPDYVFEAILEEKKKYEANRRRRSTVFQDLGYICCSSYGRPRSRTFHFVHFVKLLDECGFPRIGWHSLRRTYCTLLAENGFSPKAIAKLLGHSEDIVTQDYYMDMKKSNPDYMPEVDEFFEEILPKENNREKVTDLTDIVVDLEDVLKQKCENVPKRE